MKTTCLLFLAMSWAALMHGTSDPGPPNQISEQPPSESREKTVSDRPRNGNDSRVRGEKDQAGGGHSNEKESGNHNADRNGENRPTHITRALLKRRFQQPPSNQALSTRKPGNHNPRTNTLGNALDFPMRRPSRSLGLAGKTAGNRSLPVPAALSGQQFKNAHNRGASLAIIGGPANSTRNTAAVNGTSMNRKR